MMHRMIFISVCTYITSKSFFDTGIASNSNSLEITSSTAFKGHGTVATVKDKIAWQT